LKGDNKDVVNTYIRSLDMQLTPSRTGNATSFTILANKLLDSTIHLIRVTVGKKVLSTFNDLQLRIRTPHKQFDLPLRISDRVNSIRSTMQPKHWAHNVRKPSMQTVTIPQVDGSHADALPSFLADIVGLDLVSPEIADVLRTVFTKTDVDEEVGEVVSRLEVGYGFERSPLVDVDCEVFGGVPAA
jgi:hypothetical protein